MVSNNVVSAQETADITKVAEQGAQEVSVTDSVVNMLTDVEVSLITCYPGSRNYELYGHTMVRVKLGEEDLLFNYGIFNFKQSGFVYRFVKGECDYKLAAYPFKYLTQGYEGRRIVEQVLNLDDAQKLDIVGYLWENMKPENATYRYDWAYNNCATKPRDIIEAAVGGLVEYAEPKRSGATFRDIMSHYAANYPWQQFGIDLVLGYELDHVLEYSEQMFCPIILQEALADATYEVGNTTVPLVKTTNILIDGGEEGAVLGPTPFVMTPMFVMCVLLLAVLAITVLERKNGKLYRWFDTVVFGVFGVIGLLVAFLVLVSTHYGTTTNLHIMWLHPLLLIPALFVWIKPMRGLVAIVHLVNALLIVILAVIWNWLPQVGNAAIIPMAAISLVRSVNFVAALKDRRVNL